MADVLDVAQEIIELRGEMTAMKLQKLVYYAQAWHLVWAEHPLFSNRIEAWRDGPVCPDLWRMHANSFLVSDIQGGNSNRLTSREKRTISKVVKFYGKKTAQWLSDLTHMEDPWVKARRDSAPGERSNAVISHASMHRYYSSL
ncbi:type II toxin-antitoxin system antitoxin SocA domain-containing protein [Mesorhizobium sp. WSM3868]|uniref:Panacea domain-containing protein n=1 Tax=Mesorhizobium sp. WSM3868 TaxID=2029405 RepID=UPI000BB009C3|nr:type II toxin-antitoxin system antitoxin SocA domain-containing protein [Mesorhizobium sp. WSM3868]PBB39204.1 hypothetical protein CK221_03285 [Mesorhizobium sp. WSM3868]